MTLEEFKRFVAEIPDEYNDKEVLFEGCDCDRVPSGNIARFGDAIVFETTT